MSFVDWVEEKSLPNSAQQLSDLISNRRNCLFRSTREQIGKSFIDPLAKRQSRKILLVK